MESVITAVFALAERKIGAIVVMERSGSLEPYVEGSQRLDARISSELIQSVFHPTSPIHDGAIVIRKDRIVAAGVFLPLSLSKDLSKAFGTRHRAAIGLSDATDALVLVVSEERGTVTVVQDGKLTAIVDSNDLRQAISVGLDAPERPNDSVDETAS
jgi:diadenylate cyclase